MPRKPSDDIRDAKRDLKIKKQQIKELEYNSKGESKGWSADPAVKKTKDYRSNKDGFRVDWEEKHHLQGLNLYDSYTEGMSAAQIKIVDERLAAQGMIKGNVGPNRIDLPRRFHESSKHEGYEGAHQITKREGIDSKAELDRIRSLSPEQKLNELDQFIEKQVKHKRVGQQQFMKQFQLEPGNNSSTNAFGGNFSQGVLQNRNKSATLKAGRALTAERKALLRISPPKGLNTAAKALSIPLLGGLMAGGATLLSGGDAMAALGDAIDAENPLDGGALGDGTVSGYQQERNNNPIHYGKNGPNVPLPGQRERAAELRINPSSERGYESLGRVIKDGWNGFKSLFINQ